MKQRELVLNINGQDYTVTIEEFTAEEATLRVNGKQYRVGLKDLGMETVSEIKPVPVKRVEAVKTHVPAAEKTGKAGEARLHRPKALDSFSIPSPLPGQIIKIMVEEGQVIKVGEPIMLLEAMKMENEVHSTAEGMIIDIRFRVGDSVNQGDTLILLKPAE